ncbi:MAG: AAA family ATPase, partial [Bacteroidales bacterium]
ANTVLSTISKRKENIVSKAIDIFGRLRPQVSYNSLSGIPQVSFILQTDAEKQATLSEIFEILESQKQPNYIAIDEFQQISRYPELNTEQVLRSYIQHLKKTFFIFSGSQRHLLTPMFSDPQRAFYQSTSFLDLKKLDYNTYKSFIIQQFELNKQKVSPELVDFILNWTKSYTFYTQYLCNRIFSKRKSKISEDLVKQSINEIFAERETVFYNYRNLLSHHQYQLLSAIALEDRVTEPTGQIFMKKYDLSNASTVRKNIQALLDKEMIYEIPGDEKTGYEVYDVFLSRWFQWKRELS